MRIDINYTSLAQKLKQKIITNLLEKKKRRTAQRGPSRLGPRVTVVHGGETRARADAYAKEPSAFN